MHRLLLACALSTLATALQAADDFANADGIPTLRITSVKTGDKKSQPLEVSFELSTDGKTPIALAQSQFSAQIFAKDKTCPFTGDVTFTSNDPKVLKVLPGQPITVSPQTSTNRFGTNEFWDALPPGSYILRIYINSGKSQEFDYQWLGQTYSNDHTLLIK